jgi:hypothetical protein
MHIERAGKDVCMDEKRWQKMVGNYKVSGTTIRGARKSILWSVRART